MNKKVSLSIATSLKEKGFDELCHSYVNTSNGDPTPQISYGKNSHSENRVYLPTIGDVINWLYQNHKIWIFVSDAGGFGYTIQFLNTDGDSEITGTFEHDSPEEAYENAILYTLKLI